MADNTTYTPGTGATIAADEVASALHQRVKVSLGADGTAVDAGAGAGVVGTDTQRVTLASDDPAVAALEGTLTVGTHAVTQSGAWTVTADLGANNDVTLAVLPDTAAGDLAAMVVDLAAIETLITAGNVDLAALETLVTAGNVDLAALEVLLTTTQTDRKADTGTASQVADSATDVIILAANADRLGASVYNDSSAILYLLVGSGTSSATNYTCQVASGGYYEVPAGYTGVLKGLWASDPGDGAARVTEWDNA